MFDLRKWFFTFRYAFTDPPWDTGETPPEVLDYLHGHPPGRVLDLGSGTGTNLITLARHGWTGVGVDYVGQAVRTARRKARRAGVESRVTFIKGDVLETEQVAGPFQLILDIGCFHIFEGPEIDRYRNRVHQLLAPGGHLLLYVHLRDPDQDGHGALEEDLQKLRKSLALIWREDGLEGESKPSAWLQFQQQG